MNLLIQVKNGKAINHPALEDNLIQALGEIPNDWEPFERVQKPEIQVYEVLDPEEPSYEKVDGVWKDVWCVREMTAQEKLDKQNLVKLNWSSSGASEIMKSWTFDEEKCSYVAPVPYPTDGKNYQWNEETLSWLTWD